MEIITIAAPKLRINSYRLIISEKLETIRDVKIIIMMLEIPISVFTDSSNKIVNITNRTFSLNKTDLI